MDMPSSWRSQSNSASGALCKVGPSAAHHWHPLRLMLTRRRGKKRLGGDAVAVELAEPQPERDEGDKQRQARDVIVAADLDDLFGSQRRHRHLVPGSVGRQSSARRFRSEKVRVWRKRSPFCGLCIGMDDEQLSRLIHDSTLAPPPSAEHLEAILARHGRRRAGVAAALVAVVGLIAAGVVVFARSSGHTAQRVQTVATLRPSQLAAAVATQPLPSSAGQSPTPPVSFERVFLRTTGSGVSMRVYLGTVHGPLPCPEGQLCPPPQCWPHTIVHVGLSTETAVGELAAPADGPAPEIIALVGATGFGLPGVSSNFALVVRAGPSVTTLRS